MYYGKQWRLILDPHMVITSSDKVEFFEDNSDHFLIFQILTENICCEPSLDSSSEGS